MGPFDDLVPANGPRPTAGPAALPPPRAPQPAPPPAPRTGRIAAPPQTIAPVEAERLDLARNADARAAESNAIAQQNAAITAGRYSADMADRERRLAQGPVAEAAESERKAAGFYRRAMNAERSYGNIDFDPAAPNRQAPEPRSLFGQFLNNNMPNALNSLPAGIGNSSERQLADQAQREFIAAVLRYDSGAAIPDEEYISAARVYYPMPGDSPAVIAQKARSRREAMLGLGTSSGRLRQQTEAEFAAEQARAGGGGAPPGQGDDDPGGPVSLSVVNEGRDDDPRAGFRFTRGQESELLTYLNSNAGRLTPEMINAESVRLGGGPVSNAQEIADALNSGEEIGTGIDYSTVDSIRTAELEAELQRRGGRAADMSGGGFGQNVDAAVRGAADTVSLGFADEIAAAGDTIFSGGTMEDNLALQRYVDQRDSETNFGSRLGGQIAGGFLLPTRIGSAGSNAGRAAMLETGDMSAARTAARSAATRQATVEGGAFGTAYGFGSGEGDITDRLGSAAVGGTVGGVAGNLIGRVLPVSRDYASAVPEGFDNRLYRENLGPNYQAGEELPAYAYRNVRSPEELRSIQESGFIRPNPGQQSKYFTMSDAEVPPVGNQGGTVIRVPSDRIPQGAPARASDAEIWNNGSQSWEGINALNPNRFDGPLARPVNALMDASERRRAARAGEFDVNVVQAGERQGIPIRQPDARPSTRADYGAVEASEGGNAIVQRAIAEDASALQGRVREIGGDGRPLTGDNYGLGELAQNATNRASDKLRTNAQRLYDRVDNVAPGFRVEPTQTTQAIEGAIASLQSGGNVATTAEANVLRGIAQDFAQTGLTVKSLQTQRRNARQLLRNAGADPDAADAMLMDIMTTAGRELEQGLSSNPQALSALQQANALWTERAILRREIGRLFVGTRNQPVSPETAATRLNQLFTARGNSNRAIGLIREMEPSERADLRATVMEGLLQTRSGNEAGFGAISTNILELNPRAIRELFGEDGVAAIRDIQTIAKAKADGLSRVNRSNTGVVTARNDNTFRTVIMSAMGGSLGGIPGALAAGVGGKGIANFTAARRARLLTNPDFTRWMRQTPTSINPQVIQRHFDRLQAITARNPAMAADARALQEYLRQTFAASPMRAAAQGEEEQNRGQIPPQ